MIIGVFLVILFVNGFTNLIVELNTNYNTTGYDEGEVNKLFGTFNRGSNMLNQSELIENSIKNAGINSTSSDISLSFSTGFLDAVKLTYQTPNVIRSMITYVSEGLGLPNYFLWVIGGIIGFIMAMLIINIFWKVT